MSALRVPQGPIAYSGTYRLIMMHHFLWGFAVLLDTIDFVFRLLYEKLLLLILGKHSYSRPNTRPEALEGRFDY